MMLVPSEVPSALSELYRQPDCRILRYTNQLQQYDIYSYLRQYLQRSNVVVDTLHNTAIQIPVASTFTVVNPTRAFSTRSPLVLPVGMNSVYVCSSKVNQSVYGWNCSGYSYWYGQRLRLP